MEISVIELNEELKQLDPKYLPIVQETGDSETSIMSQKAITEALANVGNNPEEKSNIWVGSASEFESISPEEDTFYYIYEE